MQQGTLATLLIAGLFAVVQPGWSAPSIGAQAPDSRQKLPVITAKSQTESRKPKTDVPHQASNRKSQTKIDGWLFRQKKVDTGEQEVCVTENAIRFNNLTHGFQAVCKAPDWKVTLFRTGAPKVWQGSLREFKGTMIIAPLTLPTRKSGIGVKAGVTSQDGLKCSVYTSGNSVILAPDAVKIAPQASEFVGRYYDLPRLESFPISWRLNKLDRRKVEPGEMPWLDRKTWENFGDVGTIRLKTTRWCKKQFDASDFAVPENYTVTKDIHEITYSDKSRSHMTELLEDLGFSQSENSLSQVQAKKNSHNQK